MPYNIKVGGVWKTDPKPSVKVAGTWRSVSAIWIKVAGVWKQVYAAIAASISNRNITTEKISPTTATAGYRLQNTGQAQETNLTGTYVNISGEWETGGSAGSNYDVRVTVTSGSLSSGTAGSWLNLGTTRTWTRSRSTIGTSTVIFTVEIRDANTLSILDTATVTLNATVST